MAKKKKGKAGRKRAGARPGDEDCLAEARDEMVALAAIYGGDFTEHEDSQGFDILVVPHPGAAEDNFVSITMVVRYPIQYPGTQLNLRLTSAQGLEPLEVRRIAKALHTMAAEYAIEHEVCVFNLVTLAQEHLQDLNVPPDDGAKTASLWHQMQARDEALGDDETNLESDLQIGAWEDVKEILLVGLAEPMRCGCLTLDVAVDVQDMQLDFAACLFDAEDEDAAPQVPLLDPRGASKALVPSSVAPVGAKPYRTSAQVNREEALRSLKADHRSSLDTVSSTSTAGTPKQAGSKQTLQASISKEEPAQPIRQEPGPQPEESTAPTAMSSDQIGRAVATANESRVMTGPDGASAGGSGSGTDSESESAESESESESEVEDREPDEKHKPPERSFPRGPLWRTGSSGSVDSDTTESSLLEHSSLREVRPVASGSTTRKARQKQKSPERSFPRGPLWRTGSASSVNSGTTESSMSEHSSRRGMRPAASGSTSHEAWQKHKSFLGQSFTGLPKQVAQLLSHSFGSQADPAQSDFQQQNLRQELLMGHLVSMATSGMPPTSMAALLANLQEMGLISRWVAHCLIRQPRLFQQAFTKAFAEAAPDSSKVAEASSSILREFWKPGNKRGAVSRGSGEYTSRYETDFQELRKLGSGGFGVVMAAINRLDGRQYAVKRVPLPTRQPTALARIMREVTTLSRLQHRGVVRYFQAWREVYVGDIEEDSTDDEADAWASGSSVSESQASMGPKSSASTYAFQKRSVSFVPSFAPESTRDTGAQRSRQQRSEDVTVRRPASQQTRSMGLPVQMQEVLYIQMEFCTRTLHEVINQPGGLGDEDAWEVLRQILSALAHVHSQGIIHRDLKPANIFYDAKGDIKLGDFGLAKYSDSETLPQADEDDDSVGAGQPPMIPKSGQGLPSEPESTGVCGTSVYISPEIAQGWAEYDDKVDVYSLGVIAFEMWHPFETAMERFVLLRNLREKNEMPTDWELAHPKVAGIIKWFTSGNPAQRPSAAEVLKSDVLPPLVGDEQLKDLLRSLPDNPIAHDRTVEAIFEMAGSSNIAGYDQQMPGTPAVDSSVADARKTVSSAIRNVLESHGAVSTSSCLLGTPHASMPKQAPRLLARNAGLYALRHEMRYPFAQWLAMEARQNRWSGEAMRRYEISTVHRAASGSDIPKEYLQCDMDIITPAGSKMAENLLAEAEAVKAITEVLSELNHVVSAYEIRIGHKSLLQLSLSYIGALREQHASVTELLIKQASMTSPIHTETRSRRWPAIRVALEGLGMSGAAIKRARQMLVTAPGDAHSALDRLSAMLPATSKKRLQAPSESGSDPLCVQELRKVVAYLQTWGIPLESIAVDPLLAPHAEYYSGTVFQIYVPSASAGGRAQAGAASQVHINEASHIVAVGGRYDGLLRTLWPRTGCDVQPPGAVGLTLNADRLISLCRIAHRRMAAGGSQSTVPLSSADVLVCARGGGGMLPERMALVSALWAKHVKAEIMHMASPSLTEQYQYATLRGVRWLVTLEEARLKSTDTVTVKCLDRKLEEFVPYSEVVRFLRNALYSDATLMRTRSGSGQTVLTHVHGTDDVDDVDDEGAARRGGRNRR